MAATSGPTDSPVSCHRDWFSPPGLASPYFPVGAIRPPHHTSLSSIPRAVCGRYKPDRRRSSRGLGFLAPAGVGPGLEVRPVSCSDPQAERRVSRSVLSAAGGGGWRCKWRLWLLLRVGPLLPPGSAEERALCASARPGATAGTPGTEETKPGGGRASRMPCCPPRLSPMRLPASPGWSLKSLSRGSCLASRVRESLVTTPGQLLSIALAGSFLGLSLIPAPGSPASLLCAWTGFLILWVWPRTGAWWSHWVKSPQGLAKLESEVLCALNNVLGPTNKQ